MTRYPPPRGSCPCEQDHDRNKTETKFPPVHALILIQRMDGHLRNVFPTTCFHTFVHFGMKTYASERARPHSAGKFEAEQEQSKLLQQTANPVGGVCFGAKPSGK